MPSLSFHQAVLLLTRQDTRYTPEAYEFVRSALDFTVRGSRKAARQENRHVSGAELLEGVRRFALREYGAMSLTVLATWGIHRCEDIGQIVFLMIAHGLLSKTDQDSIHDFNDGYEFETAFRAPFRPDPRRVVPHLRPSA